MGTVAETQTGRFEKITFIYLIILNNLGSRQLRQGLYDLKKILIWSNMAKVAEMYERY